MPECGGQSKLVCFLDRIQFHDAEDDFLEIIELGIARITIYGCRNEAELNAINP